MNSEVQLIIERLYRAIDMANEELHKLSMPYRVVRSLEVLMFSDPDVMPDSPPKVSPGQNVCSECGGLMVRTGSCETCQNCGTSSGGCS